MATDHASSDEERWAQSDETIADPSSPSRTRFPSFERDVDAAIADLGGAVFPRTTRSAPVDSAWMSPDGSLRCYNADQVMLLLKSSDRVAEDLTHLTRPLGGLPDDLSPLALVLTKWQPLNIASEFRVFVRGGKVRGTAPLPSHLTGPRYQSA